MSCSLLLCSSLMTFSHSPHYSCILNNNTLLKIFKDWKRTPSHIIRATFSKRFTHVCLTNLLFFNSTEKLNHNTTSRPTTRQSGRSSVMSRKSTTKWGMMKGKLIDSGGGKKTPQISQLSGKLSSLGLKKKVQHS